MLLHGIIGRGVVTALALVVACPAAIAQVQAPGTTTNLGNAQGQPPAPLVDWATVQQAHRIVEGWVRQGAVDEAQGVPIRVTDVWAVRVTLRMMGHQVGVGTAYAGDPQAAVDAPGPAVDLMDVVTDATERALADLTGTLLDAKRRAVIGQGADPNRPAPTPADVGGKVLVDLQVARHLETIKLPGDADPAAIFGTFAPGYHGLTIGAGGNGEGQSVIWPASAIAANFSPKDQLTQLTHAHGLGVDGITRVSRPGEPVLRRFEVIHVVRPMSDLPPMQLIRGNALIPPLQLNMRSLDSLGDQLAAHLNGRFTHDGIRGTYHPTSEQYNPSLAPDEELALACYALVRHAKLVRSLRPFDASADQMNRVAHEMVLRLARGEVGEARGTPTPGAAALIVLTLVDAGLPGGEDARLRDNLARYLMDLRVGNRFRSARNDKAPALNETGQALVIAAIAAVYEQTRDAWFGDAVRGCLDELWLQARNSPNPAALPWLAMAQRRGARLLAADDPSAREALAQRDRRLAELADLACTQQILERPRLGPADVVGGVEWTPGPAGSPPNPDWRTAHILRYLAECLGDAAIVGEHNRFDWILSAGLAARFISQLVVDEPSCYYMRNPSDALRGVRLTLWNNEIGVGPTAVSLLAVTTLRESLHNLALPQVEPAAPVFGPNSQPTSGSGSDREGDGSDRSRPTRP